MSTIVLLFVFALFFYCLSQILKFYGIGEDVYGVYILFYVLLMAAYIILPKD